MNRVLNDEGLLVFETGNIADVDKKYYKFFSQFSYPDHLFFFGEKSLQMLLERTGFKCLCVYRDAILLQLLLQKVLWGLKDPPKEKRVLQDIKSGKELDPGHRGLTLKRRLRLLYRYVSHLLVRIGTVIPKDGRPLKLLVIATKRDNTISV
jgi:hypothetical protein